jgi:hypothetical protein
MYWKRIADQATGEKMEEQPNGRGSSLFLVRLWFSVGEDANGEWSGRAIHITSGRARNFVQLAALGTLLSEMLDNAQAVKSGAEQTAAKGDNDSPQLLP